MGNRAAGPLVSRLKLYLSRYATVPEHTLPAPSIDLKLSIVIPAFKEKKLIRSLQSLHQCNKPACDVEVLVIINQPEDATDEIKQLNLDTFSRACDWADKQSCKEFSFHILQVDDLPTRHAGVGLARKLGMDLAISRFELIQNPKGIIACFDADSTCDPNYLQEVFKYFNDDLRRTGCSIYFEHPLEKLQAKQRKLIALYELHLRYLVIANRHVGFPYAFHTVGSSMAVRAEAYASQGGMNKRKAGEDFYFIHKIIPLGNYHDLNSTTVYPSARISDRVPFGTGRFMQEHNREELKPVLTYNPESFEQLKLLFDKVDAIYEEGVNIDTFPEGPVRSFLVSISAVEKMEEICSKTSSSSTFRKAFFHWFNAFMIIRYLHFSRDEYLPNVEISDVIPTLMSWTEIQESPIDIESALKLIRRKEKSNVL